MGDFSKAISDQRVSKASHKNSMAYNKNCLFMLLGWDPAIFLVCWDAPYLSHLFFFNLLNALPFCMTLMI